MQIYKATFSSLVFLIVLLFSTMALSREDRLNIIFTGSLAGQLEPCGCSPKSDFGGLARISGYLEKHKADLSPYLLFDSGNFSGKDTPQGRLKAEAMIKSFSVMNYDAVAFFEQEKAFPRDFFAPLLKDQKVPVISTLKGYDRSLSMLKGNFDINVSTDPESSRSDKVNILLSSIPVSELTSLKGWDIIISSSGEETEGPLIKNEKVLVSGYPKGKKLGILTLRRKSEEDLTVNHTWVPVGNDLTEDEKVRAILDNYDQKVAKLMKDSERPPAGDTYVGSEKCAECHQPFYEQWQDTRHAKAFASLQEVKKDADPECIACHVLGFGEEGGFFSLELTPALSNVQCESCHGLNRGHLTDFSPMSPVNKQTCITCHSEENSPEFDYPVYLEKVIH